MSSAIAVSRTKRPASRARTLAPLPVPMSWRMGGQLRLMMPRSTLAAAAAIQSTDYASLVGANQTPSEFAPGQPGMTTFEGGPMSTGHTSFEGGPLSTGHTNFKGEPVSTKPATRISLTLIPMPNLPPVGDPSLSNAGWTSPFFALGAYPQDVPEDSRHRHAARRANFITTRPGRAARPERRRPPTTSQTKGQRSRIVGLPGRSRRLAIRLGASRVTPGTTPGALTGRGAGRTFVSEAAVGNVVNATDIAAQKS